MIIKIIIPIIRGILEISLAIWLAIDWVNIPKIIIWLVVIASILEGINSILSGVKNKLDSDIKRGFL